MLSHTPHVPDAAKALHTREIVRSNEARWPQASNGTHAMPLQPPPVDRFGSNNVNPAR